MNDEEVRTFGHCEHCDEVVDDNSDEYYVNEQGEVFCSVECVLEHYGVTKIEL